MRLIKFIAYNHFLLENLTNHTLFFNNVFNLNDPFEGIFRSKIFSDFEEYKKFFTHYQIGPSNKLEYYFQNKGEFKSLLDRKLEFKYKNNGVCCFSHESKIDSVLMWTHYTDAHKGLCLVFDKTTLKFDPFQTIDKKEISGPNGPHQVIYTNKYLDGDPFSKELNMNTLLTTKYYEWNNEGEYRYISTRSGVWPFTPESLIEIVFGLRMSYSSKDTIKKIAERNYKNIRFRRVELDDKQFKLKLIDE